MYPLTVTNQIAPVAPGQFFTIVYISNGTLSARVAGDHFILSAPSCVCLNAAESFEAALSDVEGFSISFHPSHINSLLDGNNLSGDKTDLSESAVLDRYFLRPFVERDGSFRGIFYPGPETDIAIRARITRLAADCFDSGSPFWPCRQRSSLMALLMLLVSVYRGNDLCAMPFGGDECVSRVASYLVGHYSEKVTVHTLCDLFDINRNALSSRFRKATGSLLMEYLVRIRIDMACRLFRETKLPANDILYRVGFNDAAHFSRTFKKIMKMTPAAYRVSCTRKAYC